MLCYDRPINLMRSGIKVGQFCKLGTQANRAATDASLSIMGEKVMVWSANFRKTNYRSSFLDCEDKLRISLLIFWYRIWVPKNWKLISWMVLSMPWIPPYLLEWSARLPRDGRDCTGKHWPHTWPRDHRWRASYNYEWLGQLWLVHQLVVALLRLFANSQLE